MIPSSLLEGWKGVVLLVVCVLVLGGLAYLGAEGALVAAIGACTTIVAYVTKPHNKLWESEE